MISEERSQYEKELRQRNPEFAERQRQNTRDWLAKHPEQKVRNSWRGHLRRTYGITIEEYEAVVAAQGGVCSICGRPPKKVRLSLDHDHKTGRMRGLLCVPCNRALGFVENHWEGIHEYLQRPGAEG